MEGRNTRCDLCAGMMVQIFRPNDDSESFLECDSLGGAIMEERESHG